MSEDSGAEIVVTAQRRAENIQDVPISVSVIGGEQLQRQSVVELRDLSRSTASLEFGAASGANPGGGASIRGIGTTAFSRAAEASVGVVVDGVVQGNANTNNLFDIARVEVLRGPQGTLFGQSVSAGVINISTLAPDPTDVSGRMVVELSGDGTLGSKFGRQILKAGVNVPVNADSAIRFSMFANRTDGVTENVYTGEEENLVEAGFRVRYLGKFGEGVTVNLIGDYSYSDNDNGGFFVFGYARPGTRAAQFNATCGVTPSFSNFEHCSDYPQEFKTRTWGASGQIDFEIGDFTLTSITAFRDQSFDQSNDIDRLPEDLTTLNISSLSYTDTDQFTQEVRLASDPSKPFSVTVGGFYQKVNVLADNPGIGGNNLYFGRAGLPGPPILRTRTLQVIDTDVKNLSGFGEARYKSGAFTVFAGGRITDSRLNAVENRQVLSPALGTAATRTLATQDTDFSWRVGAQFEPNPDLMIYGSVARGYKAAQLTFDSTPPKAIAPEKPLDFQLGLKSSLIDRRLAVNLTGFYTKVRDYQATIFSINPSTGQVTSTPLNVPEVVTKGVEFDVFGRIGSNLALNFSAIYNDAKYPTGFLAQDGGVLGGQQIAFAPKFKASLSGEYTFPLSDTLLGFVSFDGTYKGKTRLGFERSDQSQIYGGHFIFGGRIGTRVDENWSVSLFARNIGNKASPFSIGSIPLPLGDPAFTSAQPVGLHVYQNAGGRRLIGLQADIQF